MKLTKTNYQKGFTIVELLIASAVFSMVLLVALTGFLQIGRIFYKGVSNAQTQDATRQVVNDLTNSIKSASASAAITQTPGTAAFPYNYVCIGSSRYTYANYKNGSPNDGHPVLYNSGSSINYDASSANVNMGLVRDKINSGSCPKPCSPSGATYLCSVPAVCGGNCLAIGTANPTEMLGNSMRIGSLSITPTGSADLFNIDLAIAYGDDSVLDFSTAVPSCTGNSSNQKFCDVDQLSTSVFRGGLKL